MTSVNNYNMQELSSAIDQCERQVKEIDKEQAALIKLFVHPFQKYGIKSKIAEITKKWLATSNEAVKGPKKLSLSEFKQFNESQKKLENLVKQTWHMEGQISDVEYSILPCRDNLSKIKQKLMLSAIQEGNFEEIQYLWEQGVNPRYIFDSFKVKETTSYLNVAISSELNQPTRLEMLSLFLSKGANPNWFFYDNEIPTALELVLDPSKSTHLTSKDRYEIASLLLNQGALLPDKANLRWCQSLFNEIDPPIKTTKGQNLLSILFLSPKLSLEKVQFFSDHNPNLWKQPDLEGRYPLHNAFKYFDNREIPFEQILNLAQKENADVNATSNDGKTFLHDLFTNIGQFYGGVKPEDKRELADTLYKNVELLEKYHIDFTLRDQDQRMPLYYAIKHCPEPELRLKICQKLCELDKSKTNYPTEELKLAIDSKRADVAKVIINNYGLPSVPEARTLLLYAAKRGDSQVLAMLLEKLETKLQFDQLYTLIIDMKTELQQEPSQGLMDNKLPFQFKNFAKSDAEFNYNQQNYNRKCFESIQEAFKNFQNGQWNFMQTIEFLAKQRHQLAVDLGQDSASSFGDPRYGENVLTGGVTDISAKYAKYGDRIRELYVKDGVTIKKIIGHLKGQNKDVSLTQLTEFKFKHTSGEEVPDILEEVERLCMELRNPSEKLSLDELLEKIGEIHWWMAHAMPWYRGSAAITDMLCKALLMMNDYFPSPWTEGIMIDCEALVAADVHEFAKNYKQFFAYPPVPIQTTMKLMASPDAKNQLMDQILAFSTNINVIDAINLAKINK